MLIKKQAESLVRKLIEKSKNLNHRDDKGDSAMHDLMFNALKGLIDEAKVLVSDEFRLGIFMTKFPGGELNFGEGTKDCLRREFMEELNTEIDIISHYYTTD